jgi:hypothetical protein
MSYLEFQGFQKMLLEDNIKDLFCCPFIGCHSDLAAGLQKEMKEPNFLSFISKESQATSNFHVTVIVQSMYPKF